MSVLVHSMCGELRGVVRSWRSIQTTASNTVDGDKRALSSLRSSQHGHEQESRSASCSLPPAQQASCTCAVPVSGNRAKPTPNLQAAHLSYIRSATHLVALVGQPMAFGISFRLFLSSKRRCILRFHFSILYWGRRRSVAPVDCHLSSI